MKKQKKKSLEMALATITRRFGDSGFAQNEK